MPGYTFYQLQDATGGYVITRLDPAVASSPAALAAACDATPRCNAFTTNGLLKIVPASPVFAFVDLSSEDFGDCDGVYVSSRSLSGFMMPVGAGQGPRVPRSEAVARVPVQPCVRTHVSHCQESLPGGRLAVGQHVRLLTILHHHGFSHPVLASCADPSHVPHTYRTPLPPRPPQAGLTPESLRVQGQTAHRNMQAAIAAAGRVAAQLKKGGKDPRDAKKIKPSDLKKAFDDAKVRICAAQHPVHTPSYGPSCMLHAPDVPGFNTARRALPGYQPLAPSVPFCYAPYLLPPPSARPLPARCPQVPLASSDSNLGSYTYTDVLTAMVDATWDSRTASNGSTSYSYITPVRDQRSCGSCVAFAGTAVAEAAWGAGNGVTTNNADFSEQWLFFCNGMVAGDCANGWYPGNAERVITQLNQPLESSYPYQSTYNCTKNADPVQWAGGKFSSVYYTDITAAKEHIKKWGAVMTFFNVYSDFFNWKAGSA